MNDRESLAQGIRRAMLRAGLTSGELARKMNLGQSTVYKWQTGASRPNARNVRRLAYTLDVDQEDLWTGFPGFATTDHHTPAS